MNVFLSGNLGTVTDSRGTFDIIGFEDSEKYSDPLLLFIEHIWITPW